VELDDSTRRWQVTALALIATVLAALPVIAVSAPAAGDPRDDKKRVDADVARAASILEDATDRARLAAQSYATASGALPSAQERVAETRGEVIAAQVQADSARRDEAEARVTLVAATQRHDQMAHQVDEARDRVGTIVAATYKGGSFVAFGSVLDATTPADLANRIGYLDRIMATQQEAIDGLTTARWQAKEAQNEATLARQRAEAARQAADQALTRARDAQAEAETAVAAVTHLVTQRQDAMRVAEQERGASLARYEEAKAESARVEAELRAWYARLAQQARQRARNPGGSTGGGSNGGGSGDGSGPSLQPGARFLMPVEGWKSSDFGMRYDPYYRVWQLHADLCGRRWPGHLRALARWVRQLHLPEPWDLSGPGVEHLLRPPVPDPGRVWSMGAAGAGDRAGRHHRRVDRQPPAFRGTAGRHSHEPAAVAARLPLLTRPDQHRFPWPELS
jgi:hypothetical protein